MAASQRSIRAEIVGQTQATACGVTVTGRNAPVLALCRALVEAGHDPATPLEAWRGSTLCLRVRSIGEGARLTVEDDRRGRPRLRRWRNRGQGYGAAPPVRHGDASCAIAHGCNR